MNTTVLGARYVTISFLFEPQYRISLLIRYGSKDWTNFEQHMGLYLTRYGGSQNLQSESIFPSRRYQDSNMGYSASYGTICLVPGAEY